MPISLAFMFLYISYSVQTTTCFIQPSPS
jgi:hypothetical protein